MGRRWTAFLIVVLVGFSGGAAFAASRYLITSLRQIKPSVRTQLRGPRGRTGARGRVGPPGSAAASGITREFEVTGNVAVISPDAPANVSQAVCPAGDLVLSGGWKGLGGDATVGDDEPSTINGAQGWSVAASLDTYAVENHSPEESFEAVALCGST